MWRVILCLWLLVIISHPVLAESKTVHWASESWPEFTERDGSGFYFELLDLIFTEPEYHLDKQLMP